MNTQAQISAASQNDLLSNVFSFCEHMSAAQYVNRIRAQWFMQELVSRGLAGCAAFGALITWVGSAG